MDVGQFLVADAQTPKLIEPGKRPLDDLSPAPQATAMRRAAPRDEGYYPPVSQSLSDRRRIVPAVPDHAVWPTPRPSAVTLQRRNGIHQAQSFLRVVPVGAGEAHGRRHASRIANQMTLAPSLGTIGGIWPSRHTTEYGAHGATVDDGARPIDVALARVPIQKSEMHQIPDALLLPVTSSAPARHARAAAKFLRQHLPWNSAAQDKHDAGETGAIRNARASTLRSLWWKSQKRVDDFP